jgi:hypothetical protein
MSARFKKGAGADAEEQAMVQANERSDAHEEGGRWHAEGGQMGGAPSLRFSVLRGVVVGALLALAYVAFTEGWGGDAARATVAPGGAPTAPWAGAGEAGAAGEGGSAAEPSEDAWSEASGAAASSPPSPSSSSSSSSSAGAPSTPRATRYPSRYPTTQYPSRYPTTQYPSRYPTTRFPTAQPTPMPTEDSCRPGAAELSLRAHAPGSAALSAAKVSVMSAESPALGQATRALTVCLLKLLGAGEARAGETLDLFSLLRGAGTHGVKSDAALRELVADLALLDALKRHPNRVYDPAEAALVVPDFLPALSHEMPGGVMLGELCPELAAHVEVSRSHEQRVTAAAYAIRALGPKVLRKLAVIHSTPLGSPGSMTSMSAPLADLIVQGPGMVLSSSSRSAVEWLDSQVSKGARRGAGAYRAAEHIVVVPLLQSDLRREIVSPKRLAASRAGPAAAERVTGLYFRDTFPGGNKGSKQQRQIKAMPLDALMAVLNQTGAKNVGADVLAKGSKSGFLEPRVAALNDMAIARTCLMVDDGKLSKQSLYDALQVGCVPLFLYEQSRLKAGLRSGADERAVNAFNPVRDLAFARALDWTQLGLWTDGLTCFDATSFAMQRDILRDNFDEKQMLRRQRAVNDMASTLAYSPDLLDPRLDLTVTPPPEPAASAGAGAAGRRRAQDEDLELELEEEEAEDEEQRVEADAEAEEETEEEAEEAKLEEAKADKIAKADKTAKAAAGGSKLRSEPTPAPGSSKLIYKHFLASQPRLKPELVRTYPLVDAMLRDMLQVAQNAERTPQSP